MQRNQRAYPTRFRSSPPLQPRQSTRTQSALPLQTQPQNRVPPLVHAYLYRAPQGGRTFSDQLKRLAPLNSASHIGCRPPPALERPCSHADPRRLKPLDTPVHPLLRCYWRLPPAEKSGGRIQGDSAEQKHRHPTTAPVNAGPASPKTPLGDRRHQGDIRPGGRRLAGRTLDQTLSRLARVDFPSWIHRSGPTGLERPKWGRNASKIGIPGHFCKVTINITVDSRFVGKQRGVRCRIYVNTTRKWA